MNCPIKGNECLECRQAANEINNRVVTGTWFSKPQRLKRAKKKDRFCDPLTGGTERIQTAVRAFAELCLITRPRYPIPENSLIIYLFFSGVAKIGGSAEWKIENYYCRAFSIYQG